MSVPAISELTVSVHPLGNELDLNWIMPSGLPDSYKIIVFKKEDSVISDAEIDAYLLTGVLPEGVFVYDSIDANAERLIDVDVENGKNYYYSIIIDDQGSDEHSATVSTNSTPNFAGETDVIDCKTLVVEAIKRVLVNYSAKNVKDYTIRKSFSVANVRLPLIAVVRQGANDVARLWGNVLMDADLIKAYGKIEQDNILIVWEDTLSDRRDLLTNMFRTHETTIRKYLMQEGAKEVLINMGSDDMDVRWKETEVHTCSMLIQIVFDSFIKFSDQERRLPYSDVIHEGEFN